MCRPPAHAGALAIGEGYAGPAPGRVKELTLRKRILGRRRGARYSNAAPGPDG